MDVGTAFEMGYMRGANKPVFAYYDSKPFYGTTEQAGLYAERIAQLYPINPDKPGVDIHGQSIENFKMEDNLMMARRQPVQHNDELVSRAASLAELMQRPAMSTEAAAELLGIKKRRSP